MDNPENIKLVRFDMYCRSCKYAKYDEEQEPCNECLTVPARLNSHVPEMYEEAKK